MASSTLTAMSVRTTTYVAGQLPIPLNNIDNTFGAIIISNIVGSLCFGILTVQTYLYFQRFEGDPKWLRCLVATVWILDLAHSVGTAYFSYSYTVTNFYNYGQLQISHNIVGVVLMLEPPTGLLVQLYFARRNWLLNKERWLLSVLIVTIAIVAFACGEGSGSVTYHLEFFTEYARYTALVTIWLVGSATCDLLITGSVVWSLWTSKTGFRETDRFITKVIVWTINTGLLTSIAAIADIATFVALDQTLLHLAFNFTLAKLYSNTLLASLNRRRTVLEDSSRDHHWTDDIKLSRLGLDAQGRQVVGPGVGVGILPYHAGDLHAGSRTTVNNLHPLSSVHLRGGMSIAEVQVERLEIEHVDETGVAVIDIAPTSKLFKYDDTSEEERRAHELAVAAKQSSGAWRDR